MIRPVESAIDALLRDQIATRARAEQRRRGAPVGEPHGQLETVWGPVIGRPHWLYEETLLGSGVECDVWIDHDGADAAHALLTRVAPCRWTLRDLGSRGGTYVGDERIRERTIGVGDEIRIGSVRLRVSESLRIDDSDLQQASERRARTAIDASRQRDGRVAVIALAFRDGIDEARMEPILRAHAQPLDTVLRLEPSRFVLVLPGEREERAEAMASTLRSALQAIGIESRTGVAEWTDGSCRSWELLALARVRGGS